MNNRPMMGLSGLAEADGVPSISTKHLHAIEASLKAAGVEFIEENGGGPGVRFKVPE